MINTNQWSPLQKWAFATICIAIFPTEWWNAVEQCIVADAEVQRIVPVNVKKPIGLSTRKFATIVIPSSLSLRPRKNSHNAQWFLWVYINKGTSLCSKKGSKGRKVEQRDEWWQIKGCLLVTYVQRYGIDIIHHNTNHIKVRVCAPKLGNDRLIRCLRR